jgi:hypothetical protein
MCWIRRTHAKYSGREATKEPLAACILHVSSKIWFNQSNARRHHAAPTRPARTILEQVVLFFVCTEDDSWRDYHVVSLES